MFVKGKETHRFFGLINESSKLCKNPLIGKPISYVVDLKINGDVIRYARRINFNANEKQFDCSCPEDLVNGNSVVAKDTSLYIAT